MPDFLKGNYNLDSNETETPSLNESKSLTEKFEESALAKLGGSICFVAKSGSLIWNGDSGDSGDSETK